MHWSEGLISDINNEEKIILKFNKVVVIKDKFPKAKHHFLVVPLENISDIYHVIISIIFIIITTL